MRLDSSGVGEFIGVRRPITGSSAWTDPNAGKLWLYNLHYFDDVACPGATAHTAFLRSLVARWIAENPPGNGDGWEPYPTSLRIVNWIKGVQSGVLAPNDVRQSLAVQARWLSENLEHHLLGNHLWANAKALVFAGVYFDGAEAMEWLDKGAALLLREASEQVLQDGGHFERSPMYHAIVLEDVLDLIQLARSYPVWRRPWGDGFESLAPRMLRWARAMSHPDGGVSFFNDAALGIAPTARELGEYAAILGIEPSEDGTPSSVGLFDSGYLRFERDGAVLLADVGPVGPDYLPAHAHADTLSIEVSLAGHRLIVNGGTGTYTKGAERERQRGTAAHSTVAIDDADSSEVWGGFRVARRARVHALSTVMAGDGVGFSAEHDGYARLRGGPIHRRTCRLESRSLEVIDEVRGPYGHAETRFHLHPAIRVERRGPCGFDLRLPDGSVARSEFVGATSVVAEASIWHPTIGTAMSTLCLVAGIGDGKTRFRMSW